MRALLAVFLVLGTGSDNHCNAAEYAKELQKAIKKSFGRDFPRYQFFGTPVSSFGTATMYPKAARGASFDPTTAGLYGNPETWWIRKQDSDEKQKQYEQEELKKVRPSGDGGRVGLQMDTSKKFDLSVVLPTLFKLLSAQGNLNIARTTKVTLSASDVENRRLDWTALSAAKKVNLINDAVVRHLDADDYLITTGDLVLHDLKATLIIDRNLSADAKASLEKAWKAFSEGSKAEFKFGGTSVDNFNVVSQKPVVVAAFVGEPPPGAVRRAGEVQVTPVKLSPDTIKKLQETDASKMMVR